MSTVPPAPGQSPFGDGWSPRLVLSLISVLCIVEAVGFIFIGVTVALPGIIEHFQVTQGGWLITAYGLTGAAFAPVLGKLADLVGKRRMILVAILVAAVGDVLCAVAPAFWMMILGMLLHGALSSTLFLGYSLMRDVYPAKLVPFSASLSVTGAGVLSIGAPFLIGMLVDRYGFRSVFVFDLVFILVMGGIVLATTPETSLRRPARLDIRGALLLGTGLAAVLVGISMGGEWGWTSAGVLGFLLVGVALLATYVFVGLRTPEPILNLRLLVRPAILFGVLGGGVAYGLGPMNLTLMALLAETPRAAGVTYGLGLTATQYAQIIGPMSAASVLAGATVGLLARRTGARPLLSLGLGLLAVAALVMALAHDTFPKLLLGALILGLATGFALGAMPNLIIEGAPAEEQGSMSSAGELSSGLIGAITPIVAFAIMAPTATSPAPGVLVYGNSGITTSLLVSAAIALAALIVGMTLLRPRRTPEIEERSVALEDTVRPA